MPARTVSELARICGAVLEGDGERLVEGPASLREAGAREVAFYDNPRYRRDLDRTCAAAVVVPADLELARADLTLLRSAHPSRAFSAIVESFAHAPERPEPGVHPSAVVHPAAILGEGVRVGPLCTVGARSRLGAGAVLHPRVCVGADVEIGAGCELHPGAVVYDRVRLGRDCVVHAGAVLGADGFGFEPTDRGWLKIPQCGTVEIGDEVEIGANTTIDRGRFGATRIGRGAKVDNLVHVAHNCEVGDEALLVAQVGLAGSVRVGARAILAGQVGVGGHLEVGAGARVGGQSGIIGDVTPGAELWGTPARPRAEALRQAAHLARLPRLSAEVRDLARRLAELEARAGGSPP